MTALHLFSVGLLSALSLVASGDETDFVPPDVGFLDLSFGSCRADPGYGIRVTSEESCMITKLKTRCSAADDCLAQCLARGVGRHVGGGCAHLCFDTKFDLSKWTAPAGFDECVHAEKGLGRKN